MNLQLAALLATQSAFINAGVRVQNFANANRYGWQYVKCGKRWRTKSNGPGGHNKGNTLH